MDTWINLEVISNILSITRIDKYYYCITYDNKEEWVIYNPEGGNINFKCNFGSFKGIPCVELSNKYSMVMAIQSLMVNFEGYTNQES